MSIIYDGTARTDPRLGRHVHHDSRSRMFAFPTEGLTVQSVVHERKIPILDQGQVGSCTGNAGVGAIGSEPLYDADKAETAYPMNESGAVKLYSAAETIDGDGPYPPNDNGSCGLSIAKALQAAKVIAGYQHTFTLDAALLALSVTPFIAGMNWYEGMFSPDPDGRVRITGNLAGGHEIVCREYRADGAQVWFDNSWGTGWGVGGRFYLTAADFGTLLARQGDVTVLLPLSVPAPTPTPTPTPGPVDTDPADVALAAATKVWAFGRHSWPATTKVANALKTWYAAKGL